MKIITILFFAVLAIYANHINWQGDYGKALQQAKKQHKILMVLLIKNRCEKCKNMVKNIFTDKTYIDELNKKVVAVIVNIDNKHTFPIEMYWSDKYPTLFFVDSSTEIFIHKPFVNVTQKDLKDILTQILQ